MNYSKLDYTDIGVGRICPGAMPWGVSGRELEAHEQLLIRNPSLRAISFVQQP